MYITHIGSYYPLRMRLKQPRQRYQTFWRDLFNLYRKEICEESFYRPGQYTFAELSAALFEKCQLLGWLDDINMLVTTNWAQEFDPDYAHWGPYLVDSFNLHCELFDVTGCGTLSPFTALHILQQSHYQAPIGKAMILGVEQTTIPIEKIEKIEKTEKHATVALPYYNGASVMVLQQSKGKHQPCYRILACDIKHVDTQDAGFQTVLVWLASHGILERVCIVTRFNSNFGKQLIKNAPVRYRLIAQKPSLLASFHYLMVIFHECLQEKYLLIIEEDVAAQSLGLLLLESV